jgi:hypothetical protein
MSGYYDVKVITADGEFTHRVHAPSDYAAAVLVRKQTGVMPQNQHDVEFVRAGADK